MVAVPKATRFGRGVAGILISTAAWSVAAVAQLAPPPPSRVAPPVIVGPPAPGRIALPEAPAGVPVPAAAKSLTFVLTGVDIEGEFPELIDTRRRLEAPLVDKRITVEQAFDFANELQHAYIDAGYPLVRVIVVSQELEQTARLKLRVTRSDSR